MGTFVESLRNYHDKKIDMKEIDPKIKEEKRKNKEEIEQKKTYFDTLSNY